MTDTSTASDHPNWADMTDAEAILSELQKAATQDRAAGTSLPCIRWLSHDGEEIRTWAAEVLETSAWPTVDEAGALIGLLDELLGRATTFAKSSSSDKAAPQMIADQLYYAATMIGRIDPPATAANNSLEELAEVETDSNLPHLHNAARRARRVLQ